MFIRKKPNKSGKISAQVVDKSSGSYWLVKTLGASSDELIGRMNSSDAAQRLFSATNHPISPSIPFHHFPMYLLRALGSTYRQR